MRNKNLRKGLIYRYKGVISSRKLKSKQYSGQKKNMKRQTIVNKILQRELKIEEHESHLKRRWTQVLRKGKKILFHLSCYPCWKKHDKSLMSKWRDIAATNGAYLYISVDSKDTSIDSETWWYLTMAVALETVLVEDTLDVIGFMNSLGGHYLLNVFDRKVADLWYNLIVYSSSTEHKW